QQVEAVKLLEVFALVEPVGGVGVAAQYNFRPAAADSLEDGYVPTRLALDLDAPIARGQLGRNLFKQLFYRILNADGNAASYFRLRAAKQSPQRLPALLSFRVPDRVFQRSLGHTMSPHPLEKRGNIAATGNSLPEQRRR